jgi:ABC-type dipeptide/oligopeptide/nickel transport system ATPase component
MLGSRTAGVNIASWSEIKGMVPSLYDLPDGCKFQERCKHGSMDRLPSEGSRNLTEVKSGPRGALLAAYAMH